MASKNHPRYKLRKRMNSIKHEPKSRFSEEATLIKDWAGLVGLETEKYYIDIDTEGCSGWVRAKFKDGEGLDYYSHSIYLSTHTFYDRGYFYYTDILRELGFNVQLTNWDGETIYCR